MLILQWNASEGLVSVYFNFCVTEEWTYHEKVMSAFGRQHMQCVLCIGSEISMCLVGVVVGNNI